MPTRLAGWMHRGGDRHDHHLYKDPERYPMKSNHKPMSFPAPAFPATRNPDKRASARAKSHFGRRRGLLGSRVRGNDMYWFNLNGYGSRAVSDEVEPQTHVIPGAGVPGDRGPR
jgi:hypothetical protein